MDQTVPHSLQYFILAVCGGLGVLMLLWRPGPNLWIGVRLPWTLADRQIWDKSWRLAAMFLLGMGLGPLISWKFFIIALIHLVVLGILYPVYLYRRRYGTWRYWKDQGWTDFRPVVRCRHCGHFQKLSFGDDPGACRCEACGRNCRGA